MRTRRHTRAPRRETPLFGGLGATPWRRFARDLALVVLTFAIGYGLSSYWIAPGALTGDERPLPRVLEQPGADARAALTAQGFRSKIEGERPSPVIARGAVVWQDPPPGTVLPPNAVVQLVLSAGPPSVTVPDVIGFALPYAQKVVEAAGARVGRVDTVRGGGPEPGVVIATRPAPGNGRPRGAPIDLVVSGPGPSAGAGL